MAASVLVHDLFKSYGSTEAVRGVSLEVNSGEIFGLLGPNGAGKTTTIECILGLRKPDSGSITIEGIDGLAEPEQVKRIIGAQLQATALQDKLTPREALKFFGSFYRNAIEPDQLIQRFSLSEKANAPFDSLSGGQKQRLALALAFVNDPKVIFLDEPTAGLDPHSRRELHEDILQLKNEGRTVVLSTHYIEEAERLCDRIAIIQGGKIIETGTPAELIQRAEVNQQVVVKTVPELPESAIRSLGVSGFAMFNESWHLSTADVTLIMIQLVQLIEREKVKLIDLHTRQSSLEEAYLKLTVR